MRLKLSMEFTPSSTWGITLANRLPREEWDKIRQKVYWQANYTCEICKQADTQLHCHEVWVYDEKQLIQRLKGLVCLCKTCHDVKHYGRSSQVYKEPYLRKLVAHWCKVNKKKESDFTKHARKAFELHCKRKNRFYIVKVGRRILS